LFSPDAADASAILTDGSLWIICADVLVAVAFGLRLAAGIPVRVHRSIIETRTGNDELPAVSRRGEILAQPMVATGWSR